nr:probable RNA-binding protein sce3 [Penaeus vannamei]
MSRHPYTISLDRTKELVARDSPSSFRDFTRDPLKEIKDNPLRDPLRDPLGYRDSLRRPRLEVMGWAKPRLLNDDLSLPNVPGVTSSNNTGSSSPKKSGVGGGAGACPRVEADPEEGA